MSANIVPEWYVIQFNSNVQANLQDSGGKLATTVQTSGAQGKQAVAVQYLGPTEATKVTQRFVPITFTDDPTDRVFAYPVDYEHNKRIDSFDRLKIAIDPTSIEVAGMTMAMRRAIDNEIAAAFFGTKMVGELGATPVAFPASQQIAVTVGGSGSACGLNVEKLLVARETLVAAEVDFDNEKQYVVIGAKQESNLLREIEITNRDYSDYGAPVLEKGRLREFLGFTFVPFQRLPTDGSGYRRVAVYSEYAMHLMTWMNFTCEIFRKMDWVGKPWIIAGEQSIGATRTEDKRICEIKCLES